MAEGLRLRAEGICSKSAPESTLWDTKSYVLSLYWELANCGLLALAAENGFNIFKGLKKWEGIGREEKRGGGKEYVTEDLSGLQSLKDLLVDHLQKKLANRWINTIF